MMKIPADKNNIYNTTPNELSKQNGNNIPGAKSDRKFTAEQLPQNLWLCIHKLNMYKHF